MILTFITFEGHEPSNSGLKELIDIIEGELKAYFHNIKFGVGGHEFDCWAGFSRDIEDLPYGFLGQLGFFNLFDVRFDFTKQRIELKTRD